MAELLGETRQEDEERAVAWSEETVYGEGTPVGVHKPWRYATEDELASLRRRCPNLSKLMSCSDGYVARHMKDSYFLERTAAGGKSP